MLRRLIMLAVILMVGTMAATAYFSLASQTVEPVFQIPYPAWLTAPGNQVSVQELSAAYSTHNLTLMLPSQLPTGFVLTGIHVPDPSSPFGYSMITYSAVGNEDFRYAEIALQVVPGPQPSAVDLSTMVNNSHGAFQSLSLGGFPVLLNPQQALGDATLQKQFGNSIYAMFWHDGLYYQIRAYSPLKIDDVLAMISSLQAIAA